MQNLYDLDDVLVAGCGNSELSEQIYDAGFTKITNVDISKAVIEQVPYYDICSIYGKVQFLKLL